MVAPFCFSLLTSSSDSDDDDDLKKEEEEGSVFENENPACLVRSTHLEETRDPSTNFLGCHLGYKRGTDSGHLEEGEEEEGQNSDALQILEKGTH